MGGNAARAASQTPFRLMSISRAHAAIGSSWSVILSVSAASSTQPTLPAGTLPWVPPPFLVTP